jgi:hypothetical protein
MFLALFMKKQALDRLKVSLAVLWWKLFLLLEVV